RRPAYPRSLHAPSGASAEPHSVAESGAPASVLFLAPPAILPVPLVARLLALAPPGPGPAVAAATRSAGLLMQPAAPLRLRLWPVPPASAPPPPAAAASPLAPPRSGCAAPSPASAGRGAPV